jgi:Rieske Fe-S protein
LKHFGSTLAGVAIVGGLSEVLVSCYSNSNPVSTPGLQGKSFTVDVAELTTDNTAKHVTGAASPSGEPLLVIRRTSTLYESLILVCKHQGCSYPQIDYNGTKIACSCHGSEYDRDGHVTHGPSTANLDTYVTTFDAATNKVTINY